MALPALKLPPESLVEERIARLESDVGHIRADVSEMKTDIRELRHRIDGVDDKIAALTVSMEKAFSRITLWAVSLAGGLLLVIARGFK